MDDEIFRGDHPSGNVTRPSSLKPGGSLKSSTTYSGRYASRLSPSLRRLHSSRSGRRESKVVSGGLQWFRGNRLVLWLMLIAVWAYLGFHVQSQWAHNNHNKNGFMVYNSAQVDDLIRISDISGNSSSDDALSDGGHGLGLKKFAVDLIKKGRRRISASSRKKNKRTKMISRKRVMMEANYATPTVNKTSADLDEGIQKRNTSYGLLVGPFGKTAENILGWSPEKRKGTCDRKADFAHLVWSRNFILVFHELSMTTAPLAMMELATELLSCGGTVHVVALSRKGGLMTELDKRGIKVLQDSGEFSYKKSMKADLVIAGSASSSPWIEQYLKHYAAGSNQILWWIMENERESFDKSKNMLDNVKMLTFLSEKQSKQWLAWCREEGIKLNGEPEIVHLSVNDELAFVAGLPCSLNTPLFNTGEMLERKNLLRVSVRKEMGLSDDDMLVVSLSSINPKKGQLFVLESAVLMNEEKLPLIDVKINSLNIPEVSASTKDNEYYARDGVKLEQVLLQTNSSSSSTPHPPGKKSKKKHLRKKTRRGASSHRLRKLLAKSGGGDNDEGKKLSSLKILFGSVGSKTNKVLYIKGILKFLSQHSELSKSLLWTPATSHVSSIYAAADVYVINAQGVGEAFDRGTVEAMAFGLPVLGTSAGGAEEIVEDKVTGLLHPIGREGIRPLALNLQFLMSNPSARKQLGSNGRLKVEKMYLKRHMYKKLANFFVKCMKIK